MKVDGEHLSWQEVIVFATAPEEKVEIPQEVVGKVEEGRKILEVHMEKTLYGVNTGFGALAGKRISSHQLKKLQENLIKSHHAGTGKYVEPEVARATALIRLNSLVKGYSGVKKELIFAIRDFLNAGLAPCMPEYGSVGASGDLAPLAAFALAISFPDKVEIWNWEGKWVCRKGEEVFRRKGLKPYSLAEKEALSLINGTPFSTSLTLFAFHFARKALIASDIAFALSMEAFLGDNRALFKEIHRVRNLQGQQETAAIAEKLLEGSRLVGTSGQVQDPYSFRCYPQVAGAAREALRFAERILQGEINAATDNPLIFKEGVFSGGNFHAQPVALVADLISIVLSYIGGISERRTFALLDEKLSRGLPAFLTPEPGLNSGLMIAQYTAASLQAENRVLSNPASVDSIPTSANQEDFVSMAPVAAKKALRVAENTLRILAIEILCACQAIDLRQAKEKLAPFTRRAYELVRREVPFIVEDEVLRDKIETLYQMLKGDFADEVFLHEG